MAWPVLPPGSFFPRSPATVPPTVILTNYTTFARDSSLRDVLLRCALLCCVVVWRGGVWCDVVWSAVHRPAVPSARARPSTRQPLARPSDPCQQRHHEAAVWRVPALQVRMTSEVDCALHNLDLCHRSSWSHRRFTILLGWRCSCRTGVWWK